MLLSHAEPMVHARQPMPVGANGFAMVHQRLILWENRTAPLMIIFKCLLGIILVILKRCGIAPWGCLLKFPWNPYTCAFNTVPQTEVDYTGKVSCETKTTKCEQPALPIGTFSAQGVIGEQKGDR